MLQTVLRLLVFKAQSAKNSILLLHNGRKFNFVEIFPSNGYVANSSILNGSSKHKRISRPFQKWNLIIFSTTWTSLLGVTQQ